MCPPCGLNLLSRGCGGVKELPGLLIEQEFRSLTQKLRQESYGEKRPEADIKVSGALSKAAEVGLDEKHRGKAFRRAK